MGRRRCTPTRGVLVLPEGWVLPEGTGETVGMIF